MENKRFLSKLKLGNSSMSVEVNLRESIMKHKTRWLQFFVDGSLTVNI